MTSRPDKLTEIILGGYTAMEAIEVHRKVVTDRLLGGFVADDVKNRSPQGYHFDQPEHSGNKKMNDQTHDEKATSAAKCSIAFALACAVVVAAAVTIYNVNAPTTEAPKTAAPTAPKP